ncbi:hypothetical protein C8F01DRAFT_1376592 [Mycena amicta]|nr:hypothetical protein C8F01DRAFT_1376592 [Mycena amicta]
MIPECDLSVLDQFQPYIKRLALNVCSPRPATTALRDISILLKLVNESTNNELKAYAPVGYALIDPARLPKEENYDPALASPLTLLHIHLVVLWLAAMPQNPCISKGAAVAAVMWPRFWAWALFLHRNHACLTHIPAADRSPTLLYTTFLEIVGGFCEDPVTKIQVFASPDLLFVCATGWKLIRKDPRLLEVERARHCYSSMHDLLVDRHVAPADLLPFLPTLLEATGGTFEHLADTMICHLKNNCRHYERELSYRVSRPGAVAAHQSIASRRNQWPEARALCPFWTALVSRGLLPLLLRIVSAICDTGLGFPPAPQTLKQALFVIAEVLMTPDGSIHLPDAIRRGLVHSVLKIAASPLEPRLRDHLMELLLDIILMNLHRFGVVAALDNEMEELKKLAAGDERQKILSFECWELLQYPLDERLSLHDQYVLGNRNKSNICANMTLDWSDGNHRVTCSTYRSEYLHAYETNLSSRDISFLRCQLDQELADARSSVVAKQVSALAKRSDNSEPIVTRFNYTNKDGIVTIDAVPYSEIRRELGRDASSCAVWEDLVVRARRSEGEIELHVAHLYVGDRERYIPLPFVRHRPLLGDLEKIVSEQSAVFANLKWEAPAMVKKRKLIKLINSRALHDPCLLPARTAIPAEAMPFINTYTEDNWSFDSLTEFGLSSQFNGDSLSGSYEGFELVDNACSGSYLSQDSPKCGDIELPLELPSHYSLQGEPYDSVSNEKHIWNVLFGASALCFLVHDFC